MHRALPGAPPLSRSGTLEGLGPGPEAQVLKQEPPRRAFLRGAAGAVGAVASLELVRMERQAFQWRDRWLVRRMRTMRPRRRTRTELRWVDDELQVGRDGEAELALNRSAGVILEACDGQRSIDQIAQVLAAHSGESLARIEPDVARCVRALLRAGWLQV